MGKDGEVDLLTKYLEYTSDNEAPELYHKWSLITVLGHLFKKNVKLNMGYFSLYPGQLYVFLVGPPAVKKSTAIRIATDFLKDFPDVHITSGKLSTQALIDSLESQPQLLNGSQLSHSDSITFIKAPELANFIPRASYMEEIIPFLTDAYDAEVGEWKYATRYRGEVILRNILLTFFGGTTPDWLFKNIPESAWGGGFMSRVLLINQTDCDRVNPLPTITPRMRRVRKEILAEMYWMSNNLKGDFLWTKEGKEWYDLWYRDFKKTSQEGNQSSPMAHYYARKPVNLLKIAMVVSIIQSRALLLTQKSFEQTLKLFAEVEVFLPDLFEKQTTNPIAEQCQKVLDVFKEKGVLNLTRGDILKKIWRYGISSSSLDISLDTLLQAELIDLVLIRQMAYYRLKK